METDLKGFNLLDKSETLFEKLLKQGDNTVVRSWMLNIPEKPCETDPCTLFSLLSFNKLSLIGKASTDSLTLLSLLSFQKYSSMVQLQRLYILIELCSPLSGIY